MTNDITEYNSDDGLYADFEFFHAADGIDWKAAYSINHELGEISRPQYFRAPDDGETPYEETTDTPPQVLIDHVSAAIANAKATTQRNRRKVPHKRIYNPAKDRLALLEDILVSSGWICKNDAWVPHSRLRAILPHHLETGSYGLEEAVRLQIQGDLAIVAETRARGQQ